MNAGFEDVSHLYLFGVNEILTGLLRLAQTFFAANFSPYDLIKKALQKYTRLFIETNDLTVNRYTSSPERSRRVT